MYNPDYPSESYGWSAFTFQPYDQPQQQMYYNGGVNSPFAASTTVPTGSRRQIGQEFANQYNSGAYQQYQQPTGYGFAQSPYAPPAYQQAPSQYPYGAPQQPAPQQQIAPPLPPTGQPSLLSPQAFQQQNQFGSSPAPTFDCLYTGQSSVWDKTSKSPAWDNSYTQERKLLPPPIDWKAQEAQRSPYPYGNVYNPANINQNAVQPQFAQPNDDWLANVKANFSL